MAGAKFQYDEQGGTFFYFLFTFQALVVIPCTYYFWPRSSKEEEVKRDKNQCHCDDCAIKNSRLRSKEPAKVIKRRLIKLALLIAWGLLLVTFYKVTTVQHDYVAWDPFEILGIPPDSSMSEIKKAYRRLSLIYHPDKETGDEKKFMKIAKAYAALTDEEARKNWKEYGNPDGPGATSFGIALPSWIVEKENAVFVLGLYALVFMILLPLAVGIWWYRSVKFGGDQVLLDTTRLYYFFIHKTPYMILKRVLMILAASMEFEKTYNSQIQERPSDNIELPLLIKELPNLGERNREKPLGLRYSIKARALLHAHLHRMKLPPDTLEKDKLLILKKCPYLLQEFVQNAAQMTMLAISGRIGRMPNLDTLENAMKLCPMIVQALWDNKSPLLQLPHVTEDMLRHFTNRKRNIKNLEHLATMKSSDRRTMLRGLSNDQYNDVMCVLSNMPHIELEVRSEVLDDEDAGTITAGAIVTVTITLIRKSLADLFDKQDENAGEEIGGDDHEVGGGNGKEHSPAPPAHKPRVWEKPQKKKKGKPKKKSGGGGGGKAQQQKKHVVANSTTNKPQAPTSAPAKEEKPAKSSSQPASVASEKPSNEASDQSEGQSDSDSEAGHSNHSEENKEQPAEKNDKMKPNTADEEEDDWEQLQQQMSKKEKVLETKSKKSHSVHCPYFPDDKQEYWWVYIAERKKHTLMTIPYLITNLVSREEAELKFTAPSKPGIYTYSVIVRSDSYLGLDVMKTIKLDVKEAKEVVMLPPLWEVSEEEEDKNPEESAVEDSDLATDDEDED